MFVLALNLTVLRRITIENRCPDAGKGPTKNKNGKNKRFRAFSKSNGAEMNGF